MFVNIRKIWRIPTKKRKRVGMCRSKFLLFDNITCTNGRGSSLAKRYKIECFTILLFGVYNGLSQVFQLSVN